MSEPTLSAPLETPETALLAAARRLAGRSSPDGFVCHMRLSRLPPARARENFAFAVEALRNCMGEAGGEVFVLGNLDIVVICPTAHLPHLRGSVQSVAAVFETVQAREVHDETEIITRWYDLAGERHAVLALASALNAGAGASTGPQAPTSRLGAEATEAGGARRGSSGSGEPLTLRRLDAITAELANADLASVIRRQPICRIVKGEPVEILFDEVYVSIAELRQRFAPGIDLTSDPSLFQILTRRLDRRVLAWLNAADPSQLAGNFSININLSTLSTVLSPEFAMFEFGAGKMIRERLVIEFQKADVFADLLLFHSIRDALRQRHYPLCLDAVTWRDLVHFDCGRMGADLYKIQWTPVLGHEDETAAVAALDRLVTQAGESRVIMCRCDSEAAVRFGAAHGLFLFQGWYVDTLLKSSGRRVPLKGGFDH